VDCWPNQQTCSLNPLQAKLSQITADVKNAHCCLVVAVAAAVVVALFTVKQVYN
jgi:hypothetical protein